MYHNDLDRETMINVLEATADEIRLDARSNGAPAAAASESVAVDEQIAVAFEKLAARLGI